MDTLVGGSGRDWMKGGDGRDVYVFADGHGHDTVNEFRSGEGLTFAEGMFVSAEAVRAALTQTSAGVTLRTGADSSILFTGTTLEQVKAATITFAQPQASAPANDDVVPFRADLVRDAGVGFDILTASGDTPINLEGSNLKGFEAVVAAGTGKQQISLSLNETFAETGVDGKGAFSVVLGNQSGDRISLSGTDWKFVTEMNHGETSSIVKGLSAAEISQVAQAYGTDHSDLADDLHGFVFQRGGQSVTIWTDLDPDALRLNGTSVESLA
jgi:hypothetical protein